MDQHLLNVIKLKSVWQTPLLLENAPRLQILEKSKISPIKLVDFILLQYNLTVCHIHLSLLFIE